MVMATEATRRLVLEILVVLAAITLLIAAATVYGVLGQSVARRWKEIGIRQAIGESPARSGGRILRHALLDSVMAVGAGLGLILLAGTPLESVLFEISPRDPVSLALAAGAVLVLGLGAAAAPALRAARIDPLTALHEE